MKVSCENCPLVGQLGNSVRWHRVYKARGVRVKMKLCDRCYDKIEVRRRHG